MLIIFDLDDTLIDTTATLTPFKLRHALIAMKDAGLEIDDLEAWWDLLKKINAEAENTQMALQQFFKLHGIEEKFYLIALNVVYNSLLAIEQIQPVQGAIELLNRLKKNHLLAIVTAGDVELQFEKMKNAGIDSQIFSKIAVCSSNMKKEQYKKIIDSLECIPSEVVVCGDKVVADLKPAKELGLTTVHMRYGRGCFSQGDKENIDYVIMTIDEIEQIINFLNTQVTL